MSANETFSSPEPIEVFLALRQSCEDYAHLKAKTDDLERENKQLREWNSFGSERLKFVLDENKSLKEDRAILHWIESTCSVYHFQPSGLAIRYLPNVPGFNSWKELIEVAKKEISTK